MIKLAKIKLSNIDFGVILINLLPWFLIVLYLYNLQIVKAGDFNISIEKIDNETFTVIPPKRGQIYVQDKNNNLYPAAISLRTYNLYFHPKASKNIQKDLETLRKIFLNTSSSTASLQKSDRSVLLQKNIDEKLKEIIKNLGLDSVSFEEYYRRVYPEKNFLSTALGFTAKNSDNFLEGKYGIERYYNEILRGEQGYQLDLDRIQAPINGKDIVLNIDYFVQKEAEKILKETIKEFDSQGGLIAVSKPNGKIIALAEEPSFDVNKFNEVNDYRIFQTKFTQNYEPGSVMKTITYLSAIENNVFNENQIYQDAGYFIINGWKVENFDKKGRGQITLGEAFEQSLNTGAVYLESLIGHNKFLISLEKFKFNQPPLIDLPNLTSGNLKQLHSIYARDVNFATASYGHGISISPAHLLLAFNAIASNGKQSGLLFLKDGKTIDFGNIIKPQSAIRIKNLIERVVLNGSGKIAKTAGFRIGGKTGSALVPKENQTERGYSEDIINTFAVILPLTNPQFTILVRIDKPIQGLARVTTVPAAKKIIEFLINYYNLQPDNPEELLEK